MTFISYAQNFEDVMLWRALKHIEKGFYIDVGAWSPDVDSVTRAFYERGWHGINIEPNPEFHQQLQRRRPHDINLQLAIGDQEATLSMNFLTNPGLSTLDDAIAQTHQQAGWEVERQPVQVTTMAKIWAEYVPAGQDVHFLKGDVEGFEAAALRGNDWSKNRPWIVVVEATLPMTQEESYGDWEPILLKAGYLYAYFDGLNRFYVAEEHPELLDAFKAPPNLFDEFVLYRQQEAEARANEAEARANEAEARANEAEAHATQAEARANEVISKLDAVYQSRSWRITRPLRELARLTRIVRESTKQKIKRLITSLLGTLIHFVVARPRLKRIALKSVRQFPRLEALLVRLWIPQREYNYSDSSQFCGPEALTPRARQIYAQLKAAIEQKQKEHV